MSTPELTFLGWQAPAIELVAQQLSPRLEDKETAPRYRRATVVVPTAESGRRLRERLAELAEPAGKPILIPRIILANQLIPREKTGVATEAETLAAWLQVLNADGADPVAQYAPLIPRRPETHRERWAVGVAHKLMALRSRLEQEEVTYDDVTRLLIKREQLADAELQKLQPGDKDSAENWRARKEVYANEQMRWRKLGELFKKVDSIIGKTTISQLQQQWVDSPQWPGQCRLLILACVPEFSPQLKRALRNLHGRDGGTVEIWVHADEKEASHFDAFGLPLESAWISRNIDMPDSSIHLVDNAEAMATKAVELAGGVSSQDMTLAVGDAEFAPALVNTFAAASAAWNLNLPEGRHIRGTDLGQLVSQLADACAERANLPLWNDSQGGISHNAMGGLDSFVALLHNSALQHALCDTPAELTGLQEQVEKIRMLLLPGSESALKQQLLEIPAVDDGYKAIVNLRSNQNQLFHSYADKVSKLIDSLCSSRAGAALKKLARLLNTRINDPTLKSLAGRIAGEMTRCAGIASALPSPAYAIELLNRSVQDNVSGPAFAGQALSVGDVLGWRELAYSRGKQVIVAAMHDGCIPEPVQEDDFLPESLCDELGIRHEKFRIARDSYLLTALLESRKEHGGKVDFIVARQKADGSVLAPSSLLLRCGEKLPERARALFAESKSTNNLPPSAPCPLRRAENAGASIHPGMLESITQIYGNRPNPFTRWHEDSEGNKYQRSYSPSSLSLFLQCPLSFWVKNLFHIDLGDTYKEGKAELESNEYGSVMHAVLDKLVAQFSSWEMLISQCPAAATDRAAAEERMQETARTLAATEWQRVYNSAAPRDAQSLPMEVQLQAIERSLRSFIHRHVTDLAEGWCNVAREYTFKPTMQLADGSIAKFSMNADRIDRHTDGRWRIIDYKTSSGEKRPQKIHFDALDGGEDSLYCKFMNVQGYEFGTVQLGGKLYRWNDVQLPLYTYGLRNPSPDDREKLGIGDADMTAVMPDLVYYNMQSKTEQLQCHYLVRDGVVLPISSRAKEVPPAEQMYQSAMQTVQSAIRMIRAGLCLFSAESLEFTSTPFSAATAGDFRSKAPRFGALTLQSDPRQLFALPQLVK